MSHCCYGDGWCDECQAYNSSAAEHAPERHSYNGEVHDATALWCAMVGRQQGRKPWSWASLPGLYEVGIWRWRSEADDGPPIPWVMATRRPEQVPW